MADEPGDEPPAEKPKYDQKFFLKLAREGKKDAWNAWRHDPANKDVRVTFAGIDFSEAPRNQINFKGFKFGDNADFSGCKWRGVEWWVVFQADPETFAPGRASFDGAAFDYGADFTGAAFGGYASFLGAFFGHDAAFSGATFGEHASFGGAAFGYEASFAGAAFDDVASFDNAAFGDQASFAGAAFGDGASFDNAAFGDRASFNGAAFGGWASFDGAAFGDTARFEGAAFGDVAAFYGAVFKGGVTFAGKSVVQWSRDLGLSAEAADEKVKEAHVALKKRHEDSWKRSGSGPDHFLTISFTGARFDGEADFSGRSFERAANFTNARFYYPPDFDNATNYSRIDFTGAYIGFARPGDLHWTSDTNVPVQLRRLRKLAEETKNHDLERDLYTEERKAERGVYLGQLLALDELKKNLERDEAGLNRSGIPESPGF